MKKPGTVRIISGIWRGSKLSIPNVLNLRPTTDAVRETLFNWLQPVIVGAHCLDMFAGSGALGFEALSRGAKSVVFIDHAKEVVTNLRAQAAKFNTHAAEIYVAQAPLDIRPPKNLFDIVFIDPPFIEKAVSRCAHHIEKQLFLAPNAYIYLESAEPLSEKDLPSNWQLLKCKKTGHVAYHLAQRCG